MPPKRGVDSEEATAVSLRRIEADVKRIQKLVARSAKQERSHDSEFLRTAQPLREERRTLLDLDRLWVLWQAAHNVAPLELPAVEVGAFRGGSASLLASAFAHALGHELALDVIDTFEGFPDGALRERDVPVQSPVFEKTSYEEVRDHLSPFARLRVLKGEFAHLTTQLDAPEYGLVHVDVDLYESVRDVLTFFGPRLATGGVMVLDDYGASKWRGVRQAAEEFLGDGHPYHRWHGLTEQLVLTKVNA